jgi:AhpC/TSA family
MLCGRFIFAARCSAILLVVCLAICSIAGGQTALDLDGRPENPFAGNAGKIVVLVFLRRDCPVSSRYAPVIQQIGAKYASNAAFWLVYPDKSDSPQAIRDYLREYGYRLPALRDPAQDLAKLSHVRITPEVAVFDRDHKLIYDGRIDDWYVDLSRARPAATTHELEEAIQSAMAGKMPAKREVRGVGCYISDLE